MLKATPPAESFHELNEQSISSMTHIIIFHVSSNKVMCVCLGPSQDPPDRIGDREVKWVDRFVGEGDGGGVQNVRRK